ncbi:MAG: two-component regulator propeller domain-containing protein, partial [Gemmatimonadota bacterium]
MTLNHPLRRSPGRLTAAAASSCLLTLAAATCLAAQERRPLSPPPAYTLQQWTTQDGLPQNSVNSVVQGPDGYLWIGTFGGLVRFDGTRFKLVARTDDTGRRHLDRVLDVAFGADGALWIATQSAGLIRRRKGGEYEVFTTADGLPDDNVTSLTVSSDGDVWIVTARTHLTRFSDGRFERIRDVGGEPLGAVDRVVGDRRGGLWIGDGDRLVSIRGGDPTIRRPDATGISAGDGLAFVDRAGGLWFERADDMARLHEGTVRAHDVPDAAAVTEDPEGGLWLGTSNDGLVHYRPGERGGTPRRYALPDGDRDFRVRSLHADRSGNVWIGTDANGLLRATRNLFTTYTTDEGLAHDVATALYEDAAGTVWAATNCGGVHAIDSARTSVRVFNPRASGDPEGDPCVFSLTGTPGGAVWQGSYGKGVSNVWGGDESGSPARIAGLPDSVALALFTDRDGAMWVGTRSGGLAVAEGGRVRETYTAADGLSSDGVRVIRQTRDGDMWVGTLAGANRISDGRITDTLAAGLHVRALHEDDDGNLWIGTYGAGLVLHRDGTSTPVTQEDGLADDVVSAILEDGAGNLWMSGNRGVHRVARSQLIDFAEGRLDHVRAVLYGAPDGLRRAETNGGFQPAALEDRRGHLWFPTVEGVAVVDPEAATTDEPPPPVTVEEAVVDGSPREPGDTIVVGPGRPNVEFHYSALSLSAPQHVAFRHRLEGFDDDWVRAGARRAAHYPRLEPGDYRFVVAAANRNGAWGESATGVVLRVTPPFWSRWWFRLAVAGALLGLAAAVIGRRARAVRRERVAREKFSRRLIESQEHERSRIAGALHDGLGQQLLVVRNRALVALGAGDVTPAVREQLEEIEGVVSDSLTSVRSLARNLTPHQLEHLGLTAALETMIDSVTDSARIAVESTVDDIDELLPARAEINLYRVVQEALNNLVRHSGADTAYVHVRRGEGAIGVTIADDGRGFEADGPAGDGFG